MHSQVSLPEQPFAQVTIERWDDIRSYHRPRWLYRGQRCADWTLTTSLERFAASYALSGDKALDVENKLSREFRRAYQHYAQHLPSDDLEWLATMQHHGCPTRLLDWTYSIYVAVYFQSLGVYHSLLDNMWSDAVGGSHS